MAGETLRERAHRAASAVTPGDYGPGAADAVLAVVAEDVDGIAEVLQAHQRWSTVGCVCGARVARLGVTSDERDAAFARHQAAMVAAYLGTQP